MPLGSKQYTVASEHRRNSSLSPANSTCHAQATPSTLLAGNNRKAPNMEGRKEWGENPAERKPCGHTNAALGFKAPRVAPASSLPEAHSSKGQHGSALPSHLVRLFN